MRKNKQPREGLEGFAGSKSLRRANNRQEKYSRFLSAGQACLCAPCRYFKVVLLPTGKVRNLCAFTGERLDAGGESLCEFRHVEGGAA